jgi:hypothetical protein
MHIDNVRARRAADGAERDMYREIQREIDGPPPPGIVTLVKRALTDTRPKPDEVAGGPVSDERVTALAVEYVNAETESAKKGVYVRIETAAKGDPTVMDRTHLAIKTEVRRRKGDPTECPSCSSQDILAFKAVWRCYGCDHKWTVTAPYRPVGEA